MKLESAVEQLLTSYMSRVRIRPGNGLSKGMNRTLRSYEEIPLIIRRTVECLAGLEYLFGFAGSTQVHYASLYEILIDTHEDWYLEMPVLPSHPSKGTVSFVRKPRVPIHRFSEAWTVARRINLLTGRGSIRLHSDALSELRQLVRSQRGGDSQTGDRGPPTHTRSGSCWHDKV